MWKRNITNNYKMSIIHFKEKYKKDVIPAMMKKFGYKNPLAVPNIDKVTVNTGFGKMLNGKSGKDRERTINTILNDLSVICGQRAVQTYARKSIAGFSLREGVSVGAKVTLRSQKMYDFLERLIHVTLPRSRDFKGINMKSIDKAGNLTIGIKEHLYFPEVSPEKAKLIFGLEIVVTTNAKNKEEGLELLRLLGFPIKS